MLFASATFLFVYFAPPRPIAGANEPLMIWPGDFRNKKAREHYQRELRRRGIEYTVSIGKREEYEAAVARG